MCLHSITRCFFGPCFCCGPDPDPHAAGVEASSPGRIVTIALRTLGITGSIASLAAFAATHSPIALVAAGVFGIVTILTWVNEICDPFLVAVPVAGVAGRNRRAYLAQQVFPEVVPTTVIPTVVYSLPPVPTGGGSYMRAPVGRDPEREEEERRREEPMPRSIIPPSVFTRASIGRPTEDRREGGGIAMPSVVVLPPGANLFARASIGRDPEEETRREEEERRRAAPTVTSSTSSARAPIGRTTNQE